MGRRIGQVAALAAFVVVLAPAGAHAQDAPLGAVVTRTQQGVPHIRGASFADAGFGYGFSIAQDNICLLADTYVTVAGRRSKFFGADGSYLFGGNGTKPNNLASDLFYQRIIDDKTVEKLMDRPAPQGPRPEVREAVKGYVAGYNAYLRETGVDNLSDPRCRGKDWVRPIEEIDAYRRFYQLALLASQGVAIDGITEAKPPTPPLTGATARAASAPSRRAMIGELRKRLPLGGIGSNAVALGSAATDNGKGMLLGNPHFPWDGSERFYQSQLTIPGKLDVAGASLMGVPVILIGHTRNLAWSHTVSTAYRFTPFELKLVPGSPTTYLVDGKPEEMKAQKVTVPTDKGDVSRTLYSTRYGPVFDSLLGQPLFPWTPTSAYAMRDANAANFRYLNHFLETNMAQSVGELDAILRRNQGIPWVNTIAADSAGKAYYADISVVPNVPTDKAKSCAAPLGVVTDQLLRLPVLDGSRSACDWDQDPDALQSGIFGPNHLPSITRDDYVTNSNDSYWLANPAQPLTGFARIIGDEGAARSLRTRSGLTMVREQLSNGGRFGIDDLQRLVFSNRQYAGELWRDDLVKLCESMGGDVAAACPVLKAWDVHDDLDSRGALLFRRFAERVLAKTGGLAETPGIFRNPFDPARPVDTPNGLDTDSATVRQALTDAVADLRSSNIPLDAPLRDFQYEMRGDERIPISGGPGTDGVFNAVNVRFVGGKGYPDVPHGSSFVMLVRFGDGCPQSRSLLTYSQSTNPESPYFADQTRQFSRKEFNPMNFCADDLAKAPGIKTTTVGTVKAGPKCTALRGTSVRRAKGRRLRVNSARKTVTVRIFKAKRKLAQRFSVQTKHTHTSRHLRPGRYRITLTAPGACRRIITVRIR